MPEKYRIIYSRRAVEQIREIVVYVELDSPDYAAKLAERFVAAIESLQVFPQRYNLARNIGAMGRSIRSMPIRPYLIRYQVDESMQTVKIVSVRHGARRPGP
jgi:addiction module RelE/StbE family toxin